MKVNLHSDLIEAINNVLLSNNLSLLQVHVKIAENGKSLDEMIRDIVIAAEQSK